MLIWLFSLEFYVKSAIWALVIYYGNAALEVRKEALKVIGSTEITQFPLAPYWLAVIHQGKVATVGQIFTKLTKS
jgi:hypothetical protein